MGVCNSCTVTEKNILIRQVKYIQDDLYDDNVITRCMHIDVNRYNNWVKYDIDDKYMEYVLDWFINLYYHTPDKMACKHCMESHKYCNGTLPCIRCSYYDYNCEYKLDYETNIVKFLNIFMFSEDVIKNILEILCLDKTSSALRLLSKTHAMKDIPINDIVLFDKYPNIKIELSIIFKHIYPILFERFLHGTELKSKSY